MRLPLAILLAAPLAVLAAAPTISGCPVFPADNYWNTPVDTLPVHASSPQWVASMLTNANRRLHPDWGNVLADNFGIPFITVNGSQPGVNINATFADESDPGPYPIPANAPVEGGADPTGDRHVIVVDTTNCVLYELYRAFLAPGGAWDVDSAAKFPLTSNALRPSGWTSADAAGLAIFPGLVRWEEASSPSIDHAIRFTAATIWGNDPATGQHKFLWPARHWSGGGTNPATPPMGARFRLKAAFDISGFHPVAQTILRAMKKYGLVLADGGSNWFFQGVSDTNWPDAVLTQLKSVDGSNFEVVDTSSMMVSADSGQARVGAAVTRLSAISTRMQVLTGDNVLIGGFIVGGDSGKTVVVRARGPSLTASGVAGALADPNLTVVRASDGAVVAANDDWGTAANALQLSASNMAPANAKESAVLLTLQPGAYTAVVNGVRNQTGVAIVEVYELDRQDIPLTAISTRGLVQAGDNVMIGGFGIDGASAQRVVVRARGPSLGVAGSLGDPVLTLVRASDNTVVATNDDWQSDANAAQLSAIGFAPADARESALLITLPPGAYTAIVSGAAGATGVAIVEVYAAP